MSELCMQPSPDQRMLTSRLVRREEDWDALRPQWEALYAASPYASPPLDFEWLREWWRIYGPAYGIGGLRIVTVWRGMELIGVLPLYQARHSGCAFGVRQLRFLSTGEAEREEICPDYLNILCRSGEEEACSHAVWICVEGLAWDDLELLDLPEQSPLVRSRALPRGTRTVPRGVCPVAELAGGFEAYLGRLSANGRQQARRLIRAGKSADATLEIAAADQAMEAFDDLARLHQARWTAVGKPGVFAAPRFAAFHRNIVQQWLPTGRAVLARLFLAGRPVVVLYGFINGSRFDFYQSGVVADDSGRLRSPGQLAHLLLMQALAEQGITAYDFLRGAAPYKTRLATCENRLIGVRAWRPTLRGSTGRSVAFAARVTRLGRRLLSPVRPNL